MNLEEQLRTTLRDRAEQAAPQPDLWASVTSGVRRDQRQRRTLIALAAVAVVAAGVTAPVLLRDRGGRQPSLPVATATASARPAWPAPIFPLRPTWLPAGTPSGVGNRSIFQMGPNTLLQYERDESVLDIEIGPLQADWETEAPDVHTAEILGSRAEVHVAEDYDGSKAGEQFVGVRWRLPDGRWVSVLSWGAPDEADVLRIARGLAGDRLVGEDPPFSLPFAPARLVMQHQSTGQMCLAPPELAAQERQPAGLCLDMLDGDPFDEGSAAETWTVGGRRVAYDPEAASLLIEWGGDTQIEVRWDPEAIPLTHDQVVELANGVRPTRR